MAKKYDLVLKGTVGYWNFNKNIVDELLAKAADREVSVLIDSLGGRVDEALSISSAFAAHGNVHVHFRGMNASAATIASMGAKRISIEPSSLYLVHKCMAAVLEWAMLNADELKDKAQEYMKMAADNEKIDLTIATMYADRCKRDVKQLLGLMRENKWLNAAEAKEWGFVDEISDASENTPLHLTASVATAMASEGMPVPNMEVEADGFIANLERVLLKVFGKHIAKSDMPDNINNQTNNNMKKTFLMLAVVLAAKVSEFEADKDGNFSLTEAQMDALEAHLNASKQKEDNLNAEIKKLQKQIDEKNTAIAELKKLPAAPAAQVVEAEKSQDTPEAVTPQEKMAQAFAEAREMMGK